MIEKYFVDTNILIYSLDNNFPKKKTQSREIILKLLTENSGVLSTQVFQEFYYVSVQKLHSDPNSIKSLLKHFEKFEIIQINMTLIYEAIDCSLSNTISFWDALIVAAAGSANCSKIYSEDLNNGQMINGIEIVNPFTM